MRFKVRVKAAELTLVGRTYRSGDWVAVGPWGAIGLHKSGAIVLSSSQLAEARRVLAWQEEARISAEKRPAQVTASAALRERESAFRRR